MSIRTMAAAVLVAVLSVLGATTLDRAAPVSTSSAPVTAVSTVLEATAVSADTAALDALVTDARYAVAVLDVESGTSMSYGDQGTFDTASIVKVDILAALLTAQDGALSAEQLQQATAMIERSDNDSATALLDDVGGVAGLEAYNATLGLDDTVVADAWGLTQTTAADQLIVLQAALQHDLARELMGQVVDEQRFGVSAAADDPDEAVLKVGYLQRSTTGLWDVTSIGEITTAGRTYLVAVLSDGNASMDAGIALTEAVAQAAVPSAAGTSAVT